MTMYFINAKKNYNMKGIKVIKMSELENEIICMKQIIFVVLSDIE